MGMTIQQVDLKSFAVAANDDFAFEKITIDGSRGETIILQCRMSSFLAFAVEMIKAALDTLVKMGDRQPLRLAIPQGNMSFVEDHIASHVHVVADVNAYALILNTLDEKQLRILLMPAQRDALLSGLS